MSISSTPVIIASICLVAVCCCFTISCSGTRGASEIIVIHGCAISIKGMKSVQVDELVRSASFTDDCNVQIDSKAMEVNDNGY